MISGLSSTNLSKKFNHFGTAICNFSKVPIHIYLQLSSDIIIHCNRDRLTLAPQVTVRCDKYLWWYHLMKFERWLELAQPSPEIWIFSINLSLSFGKHLYAYKYGKWPSPAALSPSKVPGSWYHQKETKLKSLYSASITTESQNGRVGRDIWRSLKQNSHKISLLKKLYVDSAALKTYCLILKNPYSFLETKPQNQKAMKASFCFVLPDCTAGELKLTFQSISVLYLIGNSGVWRTGRNCLFFWKWKEWEAAGGLSMGEQGSSQGDKIVKKSWILNTK